MIRFNKGLQTTKAHPNILEAPLYQRYPVQAGLWHWMMNGVTGQRKMILTEQVSLGKVYFPDRSCPGIILVTIGLLGSHSVWSALPPSHQRP